MATGSTERHYRNEMDYTGGMNLTQNQEMRLEALRLAVLSTLNDNETTDWIKQRADSFKDYIEGSPGERL